MKRQHQRTAGNGILLRALLVSLLVHVSVIFFIPAALIFAPENDTEVGLIEVERVEIESRLNSEPASGDQKPQQAGETPVAAEIPVQAQADRNSRLDQIPTQLDVVEPAMVTTNPALAVKEAAFVEQQPRLPENRERLPQSEHVKANSPDTVRIAPVPLPAEDLTKQAPPPEGVTLPSARDIQPRTERPVPAEQRYARPLSQPPQRAVEQVSPAFTKHQAPELIENTGQEHVSLQPLAPSVQVQTLPELTREALKLAPADQLPPVMARVTTPQRIATPLATDRNLPAAEPLTAAPEHPNREALNQRFQPRQNATPEPEGFPKTALPQAMPISQPLRIRQPEELVVTPHLQTALPAPELPSALTPFPRPTETKISFAQNTVVPAKPTLPAAETPSQAVVRPLPEKPRSQEPSPQALPDAPGTVHVPQDLQTQREPTLGIQLPGTGAKRSAAMPGNRENMLELSDFPFFGVVKPKEMTLPQSHEFDGTAPKDDVVKHVMPAQGKEEAPVVIEGPAAGRKVLYKPPRLPDVQIEVEVAIRLKFWVLPDGTVGEVIPLQRGDVRLERAAIQYLKSWRFTPVAPDQPTVWGIMPLKYKLK